MSKLTSYAEEAPFMNIAIEVDGKVYKFNLDTELKIHETKLNTELKEQSRSYAFICMLRNELNQQSKRKFTAMKRKQDELFLKFKAKTDKVTEATAQAKNDKSIIKMQDELDSIESLKSVLDIAVASFTQRKDLLQTLSSNTRKQNT